MIRGGTIIVLLVPYNLLPISFVILVMAKCGVGLLEVTFTQASAIRTSWGACTRPDRVRPGANFHDQWACGMEQVE